MHHYPVSGIGLPFFPEFPELPDSVIRIKSAEVEIECTDGQISLHPYTPPMNSKKALLEYWQPFFDPHVTTHYFSESSREDPKLRVVYEELIENEWEFEVVDIHLVYYRYTHQLGWEILAGKEPLRMAQRMNN